MSEVEREAFIRRLILTALSQCGGYMVPENTLFIQVNITAAPPVLKVEFSSALKWLEAESMVVGVRPDLGGAPKWKITPEGRAALAS